VDSNLHWALQPKTILSILSLYVHWSHSILDFHLSSRRCNVWILQFFRHILARGLHLMDNDLHVSPFCRYDDCGSFCFSFDDGDDKLHNFRQHEKEENVPYSSLLVPFFYYKRPQCNKFIIKINTFDRG
jgi:hypothetical protein